MPLQIKYNDNVPAPPAGKINVKWQEDADGNRSAYVDSASGDVTGPGSSTAGDIAKFADTTGKVLADSGVPVTQVPSSGEKSALAGTSGTPGNGNKYVTDADSRNSNSRTPTGSAGGDLTGTYPNPTIGDDAVTYDKMQDTAAGSILLGRGDHSPGGGGEIEEITLGTGLSMSGSTLNGTAAGAFVKIAQTVLGADASSIIFGSIPATYSDLKLICQVRSTVGATADNVYMRLNNDTAGTSNYDHNYVIGNGAANAVTSEFYGRDQILVGVCAAATASRAGQASVIEITIPAYALTTFDKHVISTSGANTGSTTGKIYVITCFGTRKNSAAINQIEILCLGGGSLKAGSVITLYGLG